MELLVCWSYIEIMKKQMETTIVYWGYVVIIYSILG